MLAMAVMQGLEASLGLRPEEICVCASHTHSAPAPHDLGDGATGVAQFASSLQQAILDVGAAAVAAAKPGRIKTGVGEVNIFRNRRTRGEPNLVDRRVPVIAAEDSETGELKAVLFGAGCHPVTLGYDNLQISGDFTGYAQTQIEAALPSVTALFFNTTEGNVIPITSPNRDALDPRGYCGGRYEDTRTMGAALADEVLRVVASLGPPGSLRVASNRKVLSLEPNISRLQPDEIARMLETSRRTLAEFLGDDLQRALPPGPLWSMASAIVVRQALSEADMRRLMIACCRYLGLSARAGRTSPPALVEVCVQVMMINDIELLALPGEVLVEVGQEWARLAQSERAFVVGLANGHLRYLPLAAHFAEPDSDVRYETVTAMLRSDGVDRALKEAEVLLKRLRQEAGV